MDNNNSMTVQSDEKFCHSCGEKIKSMAEICPKCGVRQMAITTANSEEKSLLVTILLAYFLGSFGAHNFYIDRTTKGVLSIVFFMTCVPAILSLLDILSMTRLNIQALNAKYNQKFTDCEKGVKTLFFVLSVIAIIAIPIMIISYGILITVGIVSGAFSSYA